MFDHREINDWTVLAIQVLFAAMRLADEAPKFMKAAGGLVRELRRLLLAFKDRKGLGQRRRRETHRLRANDEVTP